MKLIKKKNKLSYSEVQVKRAKERLEECKKINCKRKQKEELKKLYYDIITNNI